LGLQWPYRQTRYHATLQRTVLDEIAIADVLNMITHPPGRGTGVDGGVTQRAHVISMLSLPRLVFLIRPLASFKAAGAAVILTSCGDIFPQGMACQHLPLQTPLPATVTFDLSEVWGLVDDCLASWQ